MLKKVESLFCSQWCLHHFDCLVTKQVSDRMFVAKKIERLANNGADVGYKTLEQQQQETFNMIVLI